MVSSLSESLLKTLRETESTIIRTMKCKFRYEDANTDWIESGDPSEYEKGITDLNRTLRKLEVSRLNLIESLHYSRFLEIAKKFNGVCISVRDGTKEYFGFMCTGIYLKDLSVYNIHKYFVSKCDDGILVSDRILSSEFKYTIYLTNQVKMNSQHAIKCAASVVKPDKMNEKWVKARKAV